MTAISPSSPNGDLLRVSTLDVPTIEAPGAARPKLVVRSVPIQLDLNGVVKGKTVDDAMALLGDGWVSAGGDLATTVPVTVGLPGGDVIVLRGGGLATSERHPPQLAARGRASASPDRSWPQAGPPSQGGRTSQPLPGRAAADVAAKAALLLDARGPAWLEQRGLPGRFVDHAGDVHVNASWYRSQRGALIAA